MSKKTNGDNSLPYKNPQLAECHGDLLLDLDQSVWDLLLNTATQYPDRDAVISLWQPATHLYNLVGRKTHATRDVKDPKREAYFRWTYEELIRAVELLAGCLQSKGCVEGENLVAFLWNSAEWVLFFWVAARLKMPFIPLDPRSMSETADEYISRLRPSVIVVQDEAAAASLSTSSSFLANSKVLISCTTSSSESWISLSTLSVEEILAAKPFDKGDNPGNDIALIVFTSGTTSTPKGCLHTSENIWSESIDFDPDVPGVVPIQRWLVQTPVSHIFAINNCLRSFRYGGVIYFPSKTFDIYASVKTIEEHQCTRLSAVPTLVQGLLSVKGYPTKEKVSLHYIALAGTLIKDEDVRMCKKLGSDFVVQVYGMSEGAPVTSWLRDDPLFDDGHYPGVGKVLPGARIRVCPPSSREVLRRNVPGELHIGGTSVISKYLDGADAEAFYEDEYGSWLKTGDQAIIDENGVVHILGRYKDLIIRGGENISPAKIEKCLEQIPGLFAQVVGLPDEIAGEVPVAVVHSLMSSTKTDIMNLVEHLGPSHALAAIVTLEELGIEKYPVTSAGKVRKNVLKELVCQHFGIVLNKENNKAHLDPLTPPSSFDAADELDLEKMSAEDAEVAETIKQLTEVWSTLVLKAPGKDDAIFDFADSITLLRYTDKIWRTLGKKLYLQDFLIYDTVEKQARLLQTREKEATKEADSGTFTLSANEMTRQKDGPPGVADIAHVNGSPERFIETRHATSGVLAPLNLCWEKDVEDIIPIKDAFFAIADGPRPQSFRHRMAFSISGKSPSEIRLALGKGLDSRPLFRTLLVKMPDKTPIHVVIRPSKALYEVLITEKHDLTEDEIHDLTLDDEGVSFSRTQMVQAIIAHSSQSSTSTLIITYNHSVFDALSMIPWIRDLDLLISDSETKLLASTPFKLFADMLHSHAYSQPATLSVNYFVSRFTGISQHTAAFWPPQRAPGWMIANDADAPDRISRTAAREGRTAIRYPRIVTKTQVPHMAALKTKGIQPVIVVKTAIALFNTLQTGQEYTFFNTLDTGRSWPFMPSWIPLPPAMSIDGPTLEFTGNMLHIPRNETVGDLLMRMVKDSEELSTHAHAPLFRVLDGLGREGPFVMQALLRQAFNWDVSLQYLDYAKYGDDLKALKLVERVDWPDAGFFWEAGMTGPDELCVLATWDDAQLSQEETEGHVATLNKIIQWMIEPENWEKSVGEVF
ncbi:acetyl-CoA synthetase-like protein [Stipitochalara longipes BDJ]|nr:acetyl-CoA synthetase-like protein [Stipitochalara longipes BDJ]